MSVIRDKIENLNAIVGELKNVALLEIDLESFLASEKCKSDHILYFFFQIFKGIAELLAVPWFFFKSLSLIGGVAKLLNIIQL